MITIKCAWCGIEMGNEECNKDDKANGEISHSICSDCKAKIYTDLDK